MKSKQYQIAVNQIELVLGRLNLSPEEILCVLAKVIANASSAPTEEILTPKEWVEPYPLAVRHLGQLEKLINSALLEVEPETDLEGFTVVESMVNDNRQGLIELFAGGDRLAGEMAGLLAL